LAMARISHNNKATTQLAPLIERLVVTLAPIAEKRAVKIESTIARNFRTAAAAVDVAETIGNVLDNGVEWAKSTVKITCQSIKNGDGKDFIRVIVSDDGPGIDENLYILALGRGGRLDEGRKQNGIGSGLGLAIANDILEAIGGTITLARSDSGGLAVSMDWPQSL
ncbi:MAG: ATP-binding protein, partial [Notoacmeibacter sp.]